MREKIIQVLLLLSFAQLAHGQSFPPPGNLIVNGDFESGFSGWVGTYGLLTINNHPLNPAPFSGITVGVSLDGQNPIAQTVPTTIGTEYQLSIGMRLPDLGGNGAPIIGNSLVDPTTINLFWNSQQIASFFVQNRTTWEMYTVDFVAPTSGGTLTFYNRGTLIDGQFVQPDSVFLDNASLVAVPEPSTIALASLGAIAVLMVHRPRKA